MATQPTRQAAWELLRHWTQNNNLRKHGLAVEAAMRHYADYYHADQESWGIVGLLHDFDYEKYPSLENHPYEGQKILKQAGYPDEILQGIMAHAPHTGTKRETQMQKTIFAADELSGFIVAVALVKPNKQLSEVDVASVKKKLKQKAFAAGVNRADIEQSAQELGLTLDEHIQHVLTSMQGISNQLGL